MFKHCKSCTVLLFNLASKTDGRCTECRDRDATLEDLDAEFKEHASDCPCTDCYEDSEALKDREFDERSAFGDR